MGTYVTPAKQMQNWFKFHLTLLKITFQKARPFYNKIWFDIIVKWSSFLDWKSLKKVNNIALRCQPSQGVDFDIKHEPTASDHGNVLYSIKKDPVVGRYMVAARDIVPGEVIFTDQPAVVGKVEVPKFASLFICRVLLNPFFSDCQSNPNL